MEKGKKIQGAKILVHFVISLFAIVVGATAAVRTVDMILPFWGQTELEQFDNAIKRMESIAQIDNARDSNIQKIMSINSRYNKEMSTEQSKSIATEIHEMSIKYANLNIDLICATITHESAKTWRPDVVSHAGAMGLMQIMPATGAFLAQEEGVLWTSAEKVLFNPIYNIRLGCRYLSSLVADYEVDGGLAAYNGGARRAAMWISSGKDNSILWEETRGYIPAIMSLYEKYRASGSVL